MRQRETARPRGSSGAETFKSSSVRRCSAAPAANSERSNVFVSQPKREQEGAGARQTAAEPKLLPSRCSRGDARPSPGDDLKQRWPCRKFGREVEAGVGKAAGRFRSSRELFLILLHGESGIQPGLAVRAGHLVLSLAWFWRSRGVKLPALPRGNTSTSKTSRGRRESGFNPRLNKGCL